MGKLENLRGRWTPITVELPKPGINGTIKIISETVDANLTQLPTYAFAVKEKCCDVIQKELNENDPFQIWHRGISNIDGYFVLKNRYSGKYLTAIGSHQELEIGDIVCIINLYLMLILYIYSDSI